MRTGNGRTMHPYATASYAASLSHLGAPCFVPEWSTEVLVREIPGGGADAAGTYPVAILPVDADVAGGLARLRQLGLVSVTLVLDDFHRPPVAELRRHFDVATPFKRHFLRRTAHPFAYSRHHAYEVRRARRKVRAAEFDLGEHLEDWNALYATLTARHALADVHAFLPQHFSALARMPNVRSVGAWRDGKLLSAIIWVHDECSVHSHLAASSDDGYAVGASYAAYDESVALFADADLVNFGGAAGLRADESDGLAKFKGGFANDTADAYLCGAVLDGPRYAALSAADAAGGFFPAYRARERD